MKNISEYIGCAITYFCMAESKNLRCYSVIYISHKYEFFNSTIFLDTAIERALIVNEYAYLTTCSSWFSVPFLQTVGACTV